MNYEQRRDLERRAEGLWIKNYLKVFGCEPAMTWEELSEEEREDMRMFARAPSDGASSRPTGQLRDEPKPSPTKAPSREEVTIPREMTDDMAEAICKAINVCGGIAETIYPTIVAEQDRVSPPLTALEAGE